MSQTIQAFIAITWIQTCELFTLAWLLNGNIILPFTAVALSGFAKETLYPNYNSGSKIPLFFRISSSTCAVCISLAFYYLLKP